MKKRKVNSQKEEDRFLQELYSLAYRTARSLVSSLEVAEDIASQTIYYYLLKRDQLGDINHKGWIVTTCKNYSKQYFNKLEAEKNFRKDITVNVADELRSKIYSSLDFSAQERDELLTAIDIARNKLSEKELRTYLLYLDCENDIHKMQEITGEKNATLRQRISRIKRKIKAETYIKLGMIATKKVLNPQVNDDIKKFLISFREHLDSNTIDKMFYYFSKKKNGGIVYHFDIKEVLEFEVQLQDSIYTIHVIFNNKNDRKESFYFTFMMDKNYLKVLQTPTPHTFHQRVKAEDEAKIIALLEKYPEDDQGIHRVPDDELELLRSLFGEDE
ncbi:MAG TPA: sigma-70 family RNA polymerase sigma factor [Candidatus Cloacimonetes bacterium]|nr:sigma-70 family RNA polymerase sigma factor [Candidatus Cloacimonadota bacterium]HEX38180.1 sigma-70 family RNA polymerase sigma factor [Candidatus Cloacimonadota bacterium]